MLIKRKRMGLGMSILIVCTREESYILAGFIPILVKLADTLIPKGKFSYNIEKE
jgi:hypothetical protein